MPRWARFLSCSFTGLLLSLAGLFAFASWWEGGPGYWTSLFDFTATPFFWYLAALFGVMAAMALLLARLFVHLYPLSGPVAGFCAGGLIALGLVAFLLSIHAQEWGGTGPGLAKVWPSGVLIASPVALAGAFTSWLWDRLD